MIGLIALAVVALLLALAAWAFRWGYRFARRKGKSAAMSTAWGLGAVLLLSLPITWDAIPTWIAFEYYAKEEAGITVLKTLAQWKVENPGVAETLEPYGFKDKRRKSNNLASNKFRHLLND